MTITEYKQKVIDLFKSGKATQAQWEEMAESVLSASENEVSGVPEIDRTVMGD